MKRWTLVALCVVLFASIATAQTSGISEESLRVLQRAVVNIAIKNYSVENLIYDGMTAAEVEAILDEPVRPSIQYRSELSLEYTNVSNHGNFIIFWSSSFRSDNPVVIGHMRRGQRAVSHNYVDDVR